MSVGRDDLALFVWEVVSVPTEDLKPSHDLGCILSRFKPLPPPKKPAPKLPSDEVFESVPQYFTGLMAPPGQSPTDPRGIFLHRVARADVGVLVLPGSERVKPIDGFKSLPALALKLDHVYGYRGHDSLGNMQILSSGEIAYYLAGRFAPLLAPRPYAWLASAVRQRNVVLLAWPISALASLTLAPIMHFSLKLAPPPPRFPFFFFVFPPNFSVLSQGLSVFYRRRHHWQGLQKRAFGCRC